MTSTCTSSNLWRSQCQCESTSTTNKHTNIHSSSCAGTHSPKPIVQLAHEELWQLQCLLSCPLIQWGCYTLWEYNTMAALIQSLINNILQRPPIRDQCMRNRCTKIIWNAGLVKGYISTNTLITCLWVHWLAAYFSKALPLHRTPSTASTQPSTHIHPITSHLYSVCRYTDHMKLTTLTYYRSGNKLP